jgi:transposase-like protein
MLYKPYPLYAAIRCNVCGYKHITRSNKGVTDEYKRLAAKNPVFQPQESCPNINCPNSKLKIGSQKKLYESKGYTKAGAKRFLCLSCRTSFTVDSTRRREDKKNSSRLPFLLESGLSLRKIGSELGIKLPSVYHHIEKHAETCSKANQDRLKILLSTGQCGKRIVVGEYTFYVRANMHMDGQGEPLTLIGTMCLDTGVMLRLDLAYDLEVDASAVNQLITYPYDSMGFSRHSRTWSWVDYANAFRKKSKIKEGVTTDFRNKVKALFDKATAKPSRDNNLHREAATELFFKVNPPSNGMKVHKAYTLYAHMQIVKETAPLTNHVTLPKDADYWEAATYVYLNKIRNNSLQVEKETQSQSSRVENTIKDICNRLSLFTLDKHNKCWLKGSRITVAEQALAISVAMHNNRCEHNKS